MKEQFFVEKKGANITVIRLHWSNRDKSLVSETLYIKDGPMTLGRQYSKLVPSIRSFLQYAKGYIRKEVQRAPDHVNPYGSRTNWGEKVFVFIRDK